MKMSAQGQKFTERWEAPGGMAVLTSYQDQRGVWTIGFGHTRGVHAGITCTPAQADLWMDADLAQSENEINRLVKVQLTQNEFDALCDWEFNCGGLDGSTLLRRLNASKYDEVPAEMARWCHVSINGVETVDPGLVRRRAAESFLWTEESEELTGIPVTPIQIKTTPPSAGVTPMRPPQTVLKTTTGKLQIGSLLSGGAAAVTAAVQQAQPAVSAVHQVQSLTFGLHGAALYLIVSAVTASLGFSVWTLLHKHATVSGAKP